MVTPATEFRVNSDTQFSQSQPVMTTLADGSVIMVWTDRDLTLSMQHLDAQGNFIGGQAAIAGNVAPYEPPWVAKLADGGFVLVWHEYGNNIEMQRFAADGSAVGGERPVNPPLGPVQHLETQAVTGLADGGWLVTWRSEIDAFGYQTVYNQRYDASGAPAGQQPLIVESLAHVPVWGGSVTSLLSGGYVEVWHDNDIVQRRYDAGGQPAAGNGAPQVVAQGGGLANAVAALADGGWVVVYTGGGSGLYAQRYDASGNAVGGATLVGQNVDAPFWHGPAAAGLANGGYVVVWQTNGIGDAVDIHGQRVDASGARAGDEFVVNTDTAGAQTTPSVTALQDGGFMVAWSSAALDRMGSDVHAERFDANGVAQSGTGWLQGDAGNDTVQWDGSAPARLSGLGGNDTLAGGPGNDFVDGGAGNDVVRVSGGHDNVDGGPGIDTLVFDMSAAGLTGYSRGTYTAFSVSTANGITDLSNVERAQFSNGLFALDTHAPIGFGSSPGGNTWWAASLWHLGFGSLPGLEDLSRWTAQADQLGSSPSALAQEMLDTFAPGISNHDLVAYLYELHAHTAPTEAELAKYLAMMPPAQPTPSSAPWFATQADFLVYLAQNDFNEAGLVGFTASVQQLDPAFF